MERVDRPERLDSGEISLETVRQTLLELDQVNRWLGGRALLRRFVFPRMRRAAGREPLRVLDLACGGASASVEIARWARAHGIAVRVIALDLIRRHLDIAAEKTKAYPEITLLQADARELPFDHGSIDLVVSTLFLHHLEEEDLTEALASLDRVCRGTLVLNDLVRGRAPLLFFRMAAPLFAKSEITVQDGLISIERAYRPEEMRAIVRRAGLSRTRVHTHGLYYRMTVVREGVAAEDPSR